MNSDILVFASIAAAIVGQGLDVITTNAGLAGGKAKETNGFVAAAISKIGLPAVAFIKVAGLGIGLPVLADSVASPLAAAVTAGIVAAGGFVAGIINYRRLRAANISVF